MPKTLLLADDSVTIQKVVGISLANEDIELVTVDNGDDAVTRAREVRPDIVLADIVMPGKNGYEVCEALKSDPALAQMPVLLLTGTFEAFDAERARQAGADGHITKPFEAQALVDQVSQLLARSTPLGDEAAERIDAQPTAEAVPAAAAQAPSGAGATGEAFDFFGGAEAAGEASWPSAASAADAAGQREETSPFGGADLMADSQPSLSPGHADETVLLDGSPTTEDPAFEAAVEAAAFDAPSERTAVSFADPEDASDSGFDIETADLSMASTVPEVSPPAPDLTFSEQPAAPSGPAAPPVVTDLDAVEPPRAAAAPEPGPDATDPLVSFDLAGPASRGEDTTVVDPDRSRGFDVELVTASEPEGRDGRDGPDEPDTTVLVEDVDPARVQSPADVGTRETADPSEAAGPLPSAFQHQIHATLEKVAWEAFSDLSEQVVKQALARVEAIAWEVIPQMAETLIREEIARMKESDEG